MKTNILIPAVFFVALLISGCAQQTGQDGQTNTSAKTVEVQITDTGFLPQEVTIKAGDTVKWINKTSAKRWPASAMHPTHTKYPGVNYEEEGSYEGSLGCKSEGIAKQGAFDPCKGLAEGESWSFAFSQKGTWAYHDHLVSGQYGKVIVE